MDKLCPRVLIWAALDRTIRLAAPNLAAAKTILVSYRSLANLCRRGKFLPTLARNCAPARSPVVSGVIFGTACRTAQIPSSSPRAPQAGEPLLQAFCSNERARRPASAKALRNTTGAKRPRCEIPSQRAAEASASAPRANRDGARRRRAATMGGSSKLDKLKAMQKEGKKGIVVDKTFGLKNKNKSKKVQQFCKQVQETQNKNKGIDAESQKEEEDDEAAKLQQEMELKALFSEGLSITVKRKIYIRRRHSNRAGGGGGGAGDYYDENWAESELAKAQASAGSTELTLEQRIEKKRQELRDKGVKGTRDARNLQGLEGKKSQKLLAEKMALQKAETSKRRASPC